MIVFWGIVLGALMIAVLVALVRGIVNFMQTTDAELRGEMPSASSVRSNKLMQQRILFQALAIIVVVIILFSAGRT
ncbi:twin transmembrane helix small protein [Sphingomonas koreensis]|nr:twin transmembrane helix small protein [Sphingomonas koreensis]TPG40501.1 twin transmembrane helix small protein [Sphingomonas koreensis]